MEKIKLCCKLKCYGAPGINLVSVARNLNFRCTSMKESISDAHEYLNIIDPPVHQKNKKALLLDKFSYPLYNS